MYLTLSKLLITTLVAHSAAYSQDPNTGDRSNSNLRWQRDSGAELWAGTSVAIGDQTALLAAGGYLNTSQVMLHSTLSDQAILDDAADVARIVEVSAADNAPRAAVLLALGDAPGSFDPPIHAQVRYYHSEHTGAAWTWEFPTSLHYYADGGGTRVSDDGKRVLAWWVDFDAGYVRVQVLDENGNSVSSFQLQEQSFLFPGEGYLSDDGKRALINLWDRAYLLDLDNGTILQDHGRVNNRIMGAALSSDGNCFAIAWQEEIELWRASSGGWSRTLVENVQAGWRSGPLALNSDGTRLGLIRQENSNQRFEVSLWDFSGQATELFTDVLEEPSTSFQLIASGLVMDDSGNRLAMSSWGDSNHTTPEGVVYDQFGNRLTEVHLEGSANGLDLDPTGQVAAWATKGTHNNSLGGIGKSRIAVADVGASPLRISGYPRAGAAMDVELTGGRIGWLATSARLGHAETPFGVSQLDKNALLSIVGPFPIPASGWHKTVNLPSTASGIGRTVHLQGAVSTNSTAKLTNRVSMRILP